MHMEIWRMDKGGGTCVWSKYWNIYVACYITEWVNDLLGASLIEHWLIVHPPCGTQPLLVLCTNKTQYSLVLFVNKGCVLQCISTIYQCRWQDANHQAASSAVHSELRWCGCIYWYCPCWCVYVVLLGSRLLPNSMTYAQGHYQCMQPHHHWFNHTPVYHNWLF